LGLARAKPYRGIFLTEAGAAKAARERHRLVVDLLIAVGAPQEAAEADAEGIEHYVSAAPCWPITLRLQRRRQEDSRAL
jgi:DtxR family transcriptional regulator, manganese transport regulator